MKEKIKFNSHYDYLDLMLEKFWLVVFQKTPDEMWCAGIVSSHGDKCYGYKSPWEKCGIHFYRGALLYLLTYTKLLGDYPKYQSQQFVIDMYPQYINRILVIEKELGIDSEQLNVS